MNPAPRSSPAARAGQCSVEQFFGLEEEAEFALGGFGGVGAVDEVVGVGDAEVAADGAGGGLGAEGGAHHVAGDGDGVLALEGEDDDGGGGHEVDEAGVEGLGLVGLVVGFGEGAGDLGEFEADELEAFFLEAGEDFAAEAALDGVGFEDDERAFHVWGPFVEYESVWRRTLTPALSRSSGRGEKRR